jgi:hypothetical protein
MVIGKNVLRQQHAGAFACGVECVVGGVESEPARNVDVIDAAGAEPISPSRLTFSSAAALVKLR